MTALTEYIPDVIAYLLAQAKASSSLGAASPPVVIIDGQPATEDILAMDPTAVTQRLWIGSGGYVPSGQMDEGGHSAQGFAFIDQARTRDNQLDILCAAEAISGDMVMANARGAGGVAGGGAFGVMAAVELMLRGSPGTSPASPGDATMGGLVQWGEVTAASVKQSQITQGAVVLVQFTVGAFVRLTS